MSDGTSGFGTENVMRLFGAIPAAPVIVCRSEDIAFTVNNSLREYLGIVPPVIVAKEWPETMSDNAVVVLPVRLLGADSIDSFHLKYELSERGEKLWRFIMTHKMSNDGQNPSYRTMAAAMGLSTRAVSYILDELQKAGLVRRRAANKGIITTMGQWRPSKSLAQLSDIG